MLAPMAIQRNRIGRAFGEALKRARLEAAHTQESLAEAADYKMGYISMLESAQRQPTITAVIAFEQAMNLDPGELVRMTVSAMKGRRINPGPTKIGGKRGRVK
jgi:transcriptional regulator with XRE-family HTH domain